MATNGQTTKRAALLTGTAIGALSLLVLPSTTAFSGTSVGTISELSNTGGVHKTAPSAARGRFHAAPTPAGYGWPVKPFDRQHPVRGYFGDPRIGGAHGTSKQFHFGIDVSAPNGTP